MIAQVTKYLSEYNFSPVIDINNSHEFIYSGIITTPRFGDVKIDLHFSRQGIFSFPDAYINEISRDKFVPYHFPHLDDRWILCYHDNSIVFDTVNIEQSVKLIIENIKYIFENVQFDDMNEIIPEFKSYWLPSKILFSRFTDIPEYVGRRDLWLEESKVFNQNLIKVFKLAELTSLKACNWPINSLSDLSYWLKENTIINEIKKTLIRNLADKKDKTTFLFYAQKEEYFFGITFVYQDPLLKQKAQKKLKHKTVDILLQKHTVERLWIENIDDRNMIYSNLSHNFPTLENYKIALIGAGTIGSNLSTLLVKLGAGISNKKQLAIIDFDTYLPENYSRHILPFSDFGIKKAKAVSEELKRNNPYLNIEVFSNSVEKYALDQFDIIFDTTGEECVTDFLNRKIFNIATNAVFIISWAHITGKKVETLIIPNNNSPCHECFKHTHIDNTIPMKGETHRRTGCSSVFVPFPITLSVSASLLAIRVLLDYLQGKVNTTTLYSQNIEEDNKITTTQINFAKDCEICLKN